MALPKVNHAIQALINETATTTVDKLLVYLADKCGVEVDDELRQMCNDFKALYVQKQEEPEVKEQPKKEKKPRAPTAYNMYIKEKMAELKAEGKTGNLMKLAVEEWKKEKGNAGQVQTEEPIDKHGPVNSDTETNSDDPKPADVKEKPGKKAAKAKKETKEPVNSDSETNSDDPKPADVKEKPGKKAAKAKKETKEPKTQKQNGGKKEKEESVVQESDNTEVSDYE
jgi:hypothetical protein